MEKLVPIQSAGFPVATDQPKDCGESTRLAMLPVLVENDDKVLTMQKQTGWAGSQPAVIFIRR